MHPVLFRIGAVTVYTYGFFVACAFFVSTFLASRRSREIGIEPGRIVDLSVCFLISGMIGARVLYVLFNREEFIGDPIKIFRLSYPGFILYGGIALGFLAGFVYLRINGLNVVKVMDLVAPYVALGQSLGRMGCFFYGCCYGRPSGAFPGIYFPDSQAPLHPVQLYSSLACLLIFIILRALQARSKTAGETFLEYLMLYSLARFFLEFLRGDSAVFFAGLTAFQLISVLILFSSACALVAVKMRAKRRTGD